MNLVVDHAVRPLSLCGHVEKKYPWRVVTLHETVLELHRKNMNGVILKINYEFFYDKDKWSFLQQTLRMKFFMMSGVIIYFQRKCGNQTQ
jgi:hypothetical protein